MHGPTCSVWANLTPVFSLKAYWGVLGYDSAERNQLHTFAAKEVQKLVQGLQAVGGGRALVAPAGRGRIGGYWRAMGSGVGAFNGGQ